MRPIVLTALIASLVLIPWSTAARGGPDDKSPASDDVIIAELLAAHNKVRAGEKLPPLELEDSLTRAAMAHARDMADHSQLSHEGSDGSDPKTRIKRTGYRYKDMGENVAAGQQTVGDVMRSWIESPHHRENILGNFTQLGGAVATGPDGRRYWCVDFGRPMPAVDPEKSPGELLAALNRARAEAKKKPIEKDSRLGRVAAQFARQAAGRKKLELKDPEGRTPYQILEGEGFRARRFAMTLASGEGDPAEVVTAWMKHPKDREVLMAGFERSGVAVATDPDGVPYWLLLLAQGIEE
jgi:uncharacterized protein YkwD